MGEKGVMVSYKAEKGARNQLQCGKFGQPMHGEFFHVFLFILNIFRFERDPGLVYELKLSKFWPLVFVYLGFASDSGELSLRSTALFTCPKVDDLSIPL